MNNIYFIIISLIVVFYITQVVRHNKLPIKESFWWFIASIAMLALSIFPYSINWLAGVFGIAYPPALLLTLAIVFLLLINFRDSRRIADLQTKAIELEQQIALLKAKSKSKTKDHDSHEN